MPRLRIIYGETCIIQAPTLRHMAANYLSPRPFTDPHSLLFHSANVQNGLFYPTNSWTGHEGFKARVRWGGAHFLPYHPHASRSTSLGPGSTAGENGQKRGQIAKISASEASWEVPCGGGKGDRGSATLYPPQTTSRLASLADFFSCQADFFLLLPQSGIVFARKVARFFQVASRK